MTTFETETFAELCVRQGHLAEALVIYRRLLEEASDAEARARRQQRIADLETRASAELSAAAAPGEPSIAAQRQDDALELAWSLPAGTPAPAAQLLLLRRTSHDAGIETEMRTIRLPSVSGRTIVAAPGLYGARAAVGYLDGEGPDARFVPLARTAVI